MSQGFDDVSSCDKCGEILQLRPHFSYHVQTRMHLCDSCRNDFRIADLPYNSPYQNRRNCDDHRERRVELFCHTCRREICLMCGLTSHSSHEKEEIEKVMKKHDHDAEEQLKVVKIREEEWLQFQKIVEKSCERIEQHFQSVKRGVDSSAEECMGKIEDVQKLNEDRIKNDAQEQIKSIKRMMESKLACNTIEAQNDMKRVRESRDTVLKKLSGLREVSNSKITRITDEVDKKTSLINAALKGHIVTKGNCYAASASVAENETKDMISADMMKKALKQLGSYTNQIVWTYGQRDALNESNLVSNIWTLNHEHTLKQDPLLCSSIGNDTLLYIDMTSGSVHALDLQNGKSRPISQGEGNYTDCVTIGEHILACENVKVGLQYEVHLSQLERKDVSPTKTTIVLDHKTDDPDAVYAAVNKKGVIMVAYDGSNSIIKVKGFVGSSGTDLKQDIIGLKGKMIGIKGKKIGGMLHATPGGKFVVATGPAEFLVINEYGTVSATICDKEWCFALCGTDPLEDILYVSYQSEGSESVRIDEVELNGTIRRRGVVEYKANGMFSEPIVTSGSLLAIRNGRDIQVYKKTPFTTVLSSLDYSLSPSL